jgi:hypothetical protein
MKPIIDAFLFLGNTTESSAVLCIAIWEGILSWFVKWTHLRQRKAAMEKQLRQKEASEGLEVAVSKQIN